VLARMEEWERKLGPEFKPSEMLRRLAAAGKQFTGAA
jgi:hypothetical protein